MNGSASIRRLKALVMGAPVPVKVMGIALGLTVLFGVSFFWQVHETWHELAMLELERDGRHFAGHLAIHAASFLRRNDIAGLQEWLEHDGGHYAEVNLVQVLDGRGQAIATYGPVEKSEAPGLEILVPIGEDLDGRLRVMIRESQVAYEVGWLSRHLAVTTAVIALLGMVAAWWLTHVFTRPIHELIAATRAVKEGDYNARARVSTTDEIGELASAFNEMATSVAQSKAMCHSLLRRIINAEEEERKRVARELHDHTGQALTSLIAGLGKLQASAGSREAGELCTLAVQTLEEVHDLSLTLRPSALDDLGLVAALKKHGDGVAKRCGVRVNCEAIGLENGARLPGEIEVALYRIVQEAITNAVRHGQAHSVEVLLHRKGEVLLAVIEDDGAGFDARNWRLQSARNGHLGLYGIEERVALFGGRFSVESEEGSGASLFIEIPLEALCGNACPHCQPDNNGRSQETEDHDDSRPHCR